MLSNAENGSPRSAGAGCNQCAAIMPAKRSH